MALHESSQSNLPGRWLGALLVVAMICVSPQARAGLFVDELEPNDTFATAQNVDASFILGPDGNIADSGTIPHVTIKGTGDGSFDFYSFTISSVDDKGIFDIDFGDGAGDATDVDTLITLFDTGGAALSPDNDQGAITSGAGGSTSVNDSFLERTTWPSTGVFAIRVAKFDLDLVDVVGVPTGATYTLQISIQNHSKSSAAIPEPGFATLLGVGAITSLMCGWRRRRVLEQARN